MRASCGHTVRCLGFRLLAKSGGKARQNLLAFSVEKENMVVSMMTEEQKKQIIEKAQKIGYEYEKNYVC